MQTTGDEGKPEIKVTVELEAGKPQTRKPRSRSKEQSDLEWLLQLSGYSREDAAKAEAWARKAAIETSRSYRDACSVAASLLTSRNGGPFDRFSDLGKAALYATCGLRDAMEPGDGD